MESISLGVLYGYANGNTRYGCYDLTFYYDSVTRSGTSVTITNCYVGGKQRGTGYTTNIVYLNNVKANGTNLGISWSGKGQSYSSWSSNKVTKTITVAAETGSISITWNGGRTGATASQNGSGTLTIPTAGSPSVSMTTSSTRTSVSASILASAGTNGGSVSVSTTLNGGSAKNGTSPSWTGLTPNTSYTLKATATNSAGLTASTSKSVTTTGNNPTATSLVASNVTRTSALLTINGTYDTNASWGGWEWKYGLSTSSYGSVNTGTGSLTGLTPNTTYYATARFKDNWGRWSGWVNTSFKTTGNAPSIKSHGVQTYGQTIMTMKYSASYDTNDSLSSYKWDVGTSTSYGKTFNNTNSLTGLTANTTYYYKLTVTSSQGRSSMATGSFKTDYATQQVTSIVAEDITETSISGIVNVPNPTWLTNLTIWIYSGDTLINTITKTTGISATNNFLFEDLSPGISYEIRVRITTQTQNSSGAYNSNIKTLAVTTVDASPIHVIKSDGTDKKYKMYVMGKGNIYDPSVMGWQNGYYGTGVVGQSLSETLTQSTDTNGGAAASTTFIEILPNISYTITNDDTEVDFIIHGTDSSNVITTVGYTVSPGQSYVYEGTPDTNRLWVSIKSDTNPVVNYATAKFFRMNVFRTIEKTLIPKDNIVCLNGKIRYIDIIQAGNSVDTGSHIVALKVFDSSGEDIALNKTVTMIEGKDPLNLSRITDGNTETSDYAQISPKTSVNLETVVRVDLGKDYTDIDHVILWRYYADGRRYLNTKLYGRDATTKLTWKFQDFRSQGEYVETSEGYSSTVRREVIEGVPVILSVLQEPNNSTSTLVGTKITINADWLASVPPVLDSWISYRTDAILAANQGRLLKAEIGSLSGLTTTAKDSLVEAINEVYGGYDGSNEYTNILNAILNAVLNR